MIATWRNSWAQFSPFLKFPVQIRKLVPGPPGTAGPLWCRWRTCSWAITTTTAERAAPEPTGLIPLSLNEILNLFIRLAAQPIPRYHQLPALGTRRT
jgi:hypothetical protein